MKKYQQELLDSLVERGFERDGVKPILIARLQQQLGFILPASYRDFLVWRNGGSIRNEEIVFYGINVDEKPLNPAIELVASNLGKMESFPPILLTIGEDMSGDEYCIHKISGELFLWEHETGQTNKVANSVLEFLFNESSK